MLALAEVRDCNDSMRRVVVILLVLGVLLVQSLVACNLRRRAACRTFSQVTIYIHNLKVKAKRNCICLPFVYLRSSVVLSLTVADIY